MVVKNGRVHNFRDGIVFQASPRATIRNVIVSDSELAGILVFSGSPNALVKDCTVTGMIGIGVAVDNNSQVEGCLVEGSFRTGIRALDRALVTKNIVRGNGWTSDPLFKSGIHVGASGTVTHNTVTNNFGDGILVGPKSLVTYNTANNNGDNGIEAECPSTITNNEALGNAGLPIVTIGNGCTFGNAGNVTVAPE